MDSPPAAGSRAWAEKRLEPRRVQLQKTRAGATPTTVKAGASNAAGASILINNVPWPNEQAEGDMAEGGAGTIQPSHLVVGLLKKTIRPTSLRSWLGGWLAPRQEDLGGRASFLKFCGGGIALDLVECSAPSHSAKEPQA
jgi:hypothetical protein